MSLETTVTRRAFCSGGKHPAALSTRCKFLHCYRTLMQLRIWMSKRIWRTLGRKTAGVQTAEFASVPTFSELSRYFPSLRNSSLRGSCLGYSMAPFEFSKCNVLVWAFKSKWWIPDMEIVHFVVSDGNLSVGIQGGKRRQKLSLPCLGGSFDDKISGLWFTVYRPFLFCWLLKVRLGWLGHIHTLMPETFGNFLQFSLFKSGAPSGQKQKAHHYVTSRRLIVLFWKKLLACVLQSMFK